MDTAWNKTVQPSLSCEYASDYKHYILIMTTEKYIFIANNYC